MTHAQKPDPDRCSAAALRRPPGGSLLPDRAAVRRLFSSRPPPSTATPSAAEGIAVQLHAGCKGHLFWDILCRAGEKPHATTAFTFSGSERQETQREAPSVSLAFSCDGGISGSDISFEDDDEWGMMTRPAADLAKRTPAGETRTETVSLADYYDTYPLFFDLQLPGQAYNGIEGLQKAVRAYFQLPVPASHRVKVTVQKDGDGNTVNVELSSVGEPLSLSTVSVVTENGCYFAFSATARAATCWTSAMFRAATASITSL